MWNIKSAILILVLAVPPSTTNAFVVNTNSMAVQDRFESSTELNAQQKRTPRFSQQVHKGSGKRGNKSDSKTGSSDFSKSDMKKKKRQPWDSGRSIDELESIMVKRWGTLENANKRNKVRSNTKAAPPKPDKRRAVYDPWENDSKKTEQDTFEMNFLDDDDDAYEYYDEDDEGFEIIEMDDEEYEREMASSSSQTTKMKVDHLIAPRPAGGRGSFQNLAEEPTGSYFFNPNKVSSTPPPAETKKNGTKDKNSKSKKGETIPAAASTEESKKENKKKKAPPPSQPLLDEEGDPILLTIDEALYQFQSSVGDETMEIIESADVPIVACTEAQSWDDLGITSPILLENLEAMNCPTPLAVQEKTIPAAITGNDVLVGTYTGSGKTLAFLTPLIERLLWDEENAKGLSILVVAPGRELASQIVSVARSLLEDTGLSVQLAIGGTTFKRNFEQIRKRKPNIIVGTPGRIAELVVGKPGEKTGKLKTGNLQALVLDEFDALLEYKAHREPTKAIMQTLKRRHRDALQSILCSATASDVMDSAKVVDFLRPGYAKAMADEDDVLVTDKSKAAQVSRTVLHGAVHVPHKRLALDSIRRILHTDPVPQQILIFVENARKVDIVVDRLAKMGIIAAPLHGGMGSDKNDRAEVSRALRDGYVGIVVATELAARGLDAPLLTHVINLDLPTDASHYAHRAGRCGRGGRPGVVINITTSPQERNVPERFANALGVEMHTVEPRSGLLMMVEPTSQGLD